jgi:replicative DNA helicase
MRLLDERTRSGQIQDFQFISTGLTELDRAISGGFRLGQLVLLSGGAGVGKTSLSLQIARNIAASGQATCLFVCYEHETDYLLQRLISMESVDKGDGSPTDGLRLRDIAALVDSQSRSPARDAAVSTPRPGFLDAVRSDERGARALARISRYGHRLIFMKGSSYYTTTSVLADAVKQLRSPGGVAHGSPVVLFVDYLQKIAAISSHKDEEARNIEEIEGLKELALDQRIAILSIVAAEVAGLRSQRLRMEHLLSTPAVAYEADIIMLMNEKYDIVDRRQIEYNPQSAEQMHQYVVLSVEKNRSGSGLVDLELRKQLQYCSFRPDAKRVTDKLVTGKTRA